MNAFQPVLDAIRAAYPSLDAADLSITTPPKLDLGDIAVPMFLAAKKLGTPPPKLAGEIAASVDFGAAVASAAAAGPYLNLKLDRAALAGQILGEVFAQGTAYGSNGSGKGQTALLEHTSINPNASPHVGRARCAMIGDSLARLLRFEGYDLEVHYYVNDMGKQIGLLVLYAKDLAGLSFNDVLDAYVKANARAETDPEFADEGYALLVKMEEGDPETARRFREVVDLCLGGQLAVLARIGAQYDIFDRESKFVSDPRMEEIVEKLRPSGAAFIDEEQRLVVDLQKLGYPHEEGRFFVLRRANGSSMYGFRDLAYTIDKAARGAALNMSVLGEDHKLYQQQLDLILKACGYAAPETVYYSYILLRDGKMSTRAGKVVLLEEFLDQAEALALERVQEQCQELSPEEQMVIAKQVAVAAIRFAVLRVAPNKNVTFDLAASLAFTGDTGPYVQYCCARISSILRKHGQPVPAALPAALPTTSNAEWALLLKLADFPGTVAAATAQRAVAPVANYLLELAHTFTTFYHDCPVLTAESEPLKIARLQLAQATRQVLANALHLLGIEAPERM